MYKIVLVVALILIMWNLRKKFGVESGVKQLNKMERLSPSPQPSPQIVSGSVPQIISD